MIDLPQIQVGDREQRTFARLNSHQADALIITSATNIRWLTGFAGSNAIVVVHDDEIVLLTDARYADRAPAELAQVGSTADVLVERARLGQAVNELLGSVASGFRSRNLLPPRRCSTNYGRPKTTQR